MFIQLLFVCLLYALVESNDLHVGYIGQDSRRVYSEIKEADPALWKRTDDVIITTPPHEQISAIYITDLRENKDAEAVIESGGVGMNRVTIGLKSPTILRGYKFQIDVYAADLNARYISKGGNNGRYTDEVQYGRKF